MTRATPTITSSGSPGGTTRAETAALQGQRLQAVELLEYAGRDVANGMVAVSFAFPDGRVTISNGLDENLLEFGEPSPDFRRHHPSSDLA